MTADASFPQSLGFRVQIDESHSVEGVVDALVASGLHIDRLLPRRKIAVGHGPSRLVRDIDGVDGASLLDVHPIDGPGFQLPPMSEEIPQ